MDEQCAPADHSGMMIIRMDMVDAFKSEKIHEHKTLLAQENNDSDSDNENGIVKYYEF